MPTSSRPEMDLLRQIVQDMLNAYPGIQAFQYGSAGRQYRRAELEAVLSTLPRPQEEEPPK